MSRCRACDNIMTDKELTTKDEHGEYEDMCYKCLNAADVDTSGYVLEEDTS